MYSSDVNVNLKVTAENMKKGHAIEEELNKMLDVLMTRIESGEIHIKDQTTYWESNTERIKPREDEEKISFGVGLVALGWLLLLFLTGAAIGYAIGGW